MKFNYLSLAAMAACVTFASCSNDENSVAEVSSRALTQVNVGINESVNSRAGITAATFTNGEQIGLFVYGGTGWDDAVNGDYTKGNGTAAPLNIPYQEANGIWSAAANPIILSTNEGKVYSYYPYAAGNTIDAVKLTLVSEQGTGQSDGTKDDFQTDYMYSDVVEGVTNSTETVNLSMNHALAKMQFKFVRDTYPGDALITKIAVLNKTNGEYLKVGAATMNAATGVITVTGNAGSVSCKPATTQLADVTDATKCPSMLVYPTATEMAEGDLLLQVTMDDQVYEINLPNKIQAGSAYKFEAGKNYVYTLKLTGKGFGSEEDDIMVTIKAWNDVLVEEGSLTEPKA